MGVLENLAKNPAVLGIAALGIVAFIFRDKISDFLSNITGGAETANILGENFLSNLQGTQETLNSLTEFFTNFEFPTFENPFEDFNFNDFFGGFFGGNGGGNGADLPPDVENTGLLTDAERAACGCGTNIIQDIQGDVSETCIPCAPGGDPPIEPGAEIIGGGPTDPICVEVPLITGGTFNTCTGVVTPPGPVDNGGFIGPPGPVDEPFEPPVDLPGGFEGGGPSFEGGTIFEGNDSGCNDLSCVLFWNPGFTASQAANRLAEIQGTFGDFDFGTNTGSGFGPGDDTSGSIVTGGATLESEEKKAACLTCELFGLNCGICSGSI